MRCDFGSFRFSIYIAGINTAAILDHSFLCLVSKSRYERTKDPIFLLSPTVPLLRQNWSCVDSIGRSLLQRSKNKSCRLLAGSPLSLESSLHLLCITTLINPTLSTLNRALSLCTIQHLPLLFHRYQQSSFSLISGRISPRFNWTNLRLSPA